tara:strand:- start:12716 stop:13423 length:708 start_codon:yes stop_codon:yes gene_type:complete
MKWYEKFDYERNPFELDPLNTKFNLLGRDKEAKEILYRIISGNIFLIEGKEGMGKTVLLKHAIDNFKGHGKVIYIDGNKMSGSINVKRLLMNRSGLIKGKLSKKIAEDMILLLDNVQCLSKRDNEKIKYYFDQNNLKSVIFTTIDYSGVNIGEAVKDRIGNNFIKLKNLSVKVALEIVQERLDGAKVFSNVLLKELYESSDKNIKKFLFNCGEICELVIEDGREKATKEDIKRIK